MKINTFIYSVAIILAGILGDTTFAQSAPEQSGLLSTTAGTRSGRLHNPDSIKRAKLTRLKKDAGLMINKFMRSHPLSIPMWQPCRV